MLTWNFKPEMIGGMAKVKDIRQVGLIEATIKYERNEE